MLAESDQMLGVDPPEEGATIGGVVAANSSGPRRLRYGTVRDLIIGIKIVLADGTVAKAGGKVVKNVAGYDLSKLFTGSLGTLGVIAEANFRLHPIRETARTIFLEVDDYNEIADVVRELTHSSFSQFVLDALEMRWEGDRGVIAALFEGIEPAAEAQAATAVEVLRSHGEATVLGEEDGKSFWENFARPTLGLRVRWRSRSAPRPPTSRPFSTRSWGRRDARALRPDSRATPERG